jgi:hypothetical protein
MSPWGTDHTFTSRGGWRLVSEDSDELLSRFPAVHRLRDARNLDQSFNIQMTPHHHKVDTLCELGEVIALRCTQRVTAEKRDDLFHQRRPGIDDELAKMLAMVVVPPVEKNPANPKELPEFLEATDATLALRHDEPMRDLVTGSVALSVPPVRLPNESDGETTFSVYKADHPAALLNQSFLLIVRITRHVVTIVNARPDDTISSAGYPDVPAYGQLHRRDRSRRGQRIALQGHCPF